MKPRRCGQAFASPSPWNHCFARQPHKTQVAFPNFHCVSAQSHLVLVGGVGCKVRGRRLPAVHQADDSPHLQRTFQVLALSRYKVVWRKSGQVCQQCQSAEYEDAGAPKLRL